MRANPILLGALAWMVLTTFVRAAAAGENAEVLIANSAFQPATLAVAPGTTVTWTNKDGIRHSIKFADQTSDMLAADASFSRAFTEPGEYAYKCGRHDYMSGKIVVSKP